MIIAIKIVLFISLVAIIKLIINKLCANKLRNVLITQMESIKEKEHKNKIKKILGALIVFTLLIVKGYGIVLTILIISFGIIIMQMIKKIRLNICKKQVLCDLLNISECLRVQLSAQLPLGSALKNLSELCSNREFSGLMTNIYLEYELSKFTISETENAMQREFDYPEIRIFISALKQQIQGTSAIEAFDNLIAILREKNLEFMEDDTKSKMAIMTLGVFVVVINIALLGIYPVSVEALNAINVMLK